MSSPFLTPPPKATNGSLALLSLGRDHVPAMLTGPSPADSTGHITNTRFGSYPHVSLIDIPWGTQVLASNVGAREYQRGKKRKRHSAQSSAAAAAAAAQPPSVLDVDDDADDGLDNQQQPPSFAAAASGFAHILPPTPELWTASLPHRTQVVYVPDYSFVLQRLCARPGSRVVEAGAGSGSFTHAAARAVFNGYPGAQEEAAGGGTGRVFSFEYHEPRFEALSKEIKEHGLEEFVRVTHRDVYRGGFVLDDGEALEADAVFLDLPAPWLAIPYLSRQASKEGPSPLNPKVAVHLCSFSPCIEQAQRTVSLLRELGWVSISMRALQHSRIDVRRERVGLQEEGLRNAIATPASVDEALARLRQLETKTASFVERRRAQTEALRQQEGLDGPSGNETSVRGGPRSKEERLKDIKEGLKDRMLYKEGRLVHRTEPELKTHTSYLVFAILPREWSEEAEAKLLESDRLNAS